ncbi:MAG: RDD family protein [Ignavibacterium sp.]|nr:RDD family protein [Ignavibacterium sp.]
MYYRFFSFFNSLCSLAGIADNGNRDALPFATILIIVGLIFYFIRDGLRKGKGIGKGVANLRTINIKTNQPITTGQSAGRQIINVIGTAIYGIGFLIDIILLFADSKGRRISDFMLGTQVINEKDYRPN